MSVCMRAHLHQFTEWQFIDVKLYRIVFIHFAYRFSSVGYFSTAYTFTHFIHSNEIMFSCLCTYGICRQIDKMLRYQNRPKLNRKP